MGGGHRPYGGRAGSNFDRLYHKVKLLLLLSCNYMMPFIGYDSIKTRKTNILSLSNSHNSIVSMQKNRGDKSHRRIIDPTLVISIVVALIFQ